MAATENWSYDPWSIEEGFGSLFPFWDFSKIFQVNVQGTVGLLINWPTLTHAPTFLIENWCGYLCCLAWLTGGVWYIYATIGLIGRHFRGRELANKMYTLGGFNLYEQLFGIKPETPPDSNGTNTTQNK